MRKRDSVVAHISQADRGKTESREASPSRLAKVTMDELMDAEDLEEG